MRVTNSYTKKLVYITKNNKFDKIKICNICKSSLICGLCKSFGKTEGRKWYEQQKYYLSE